MTSSILAFLSGVMVATLGWGLFLLHIERMNQALLAAVRRQERQKAYAEGYEDRARLSPTAPGQPLLPIAK